jgi:hypothetical protein
MYYTLYADQEGNLLDCPTLTMLGQSGSQWVEPERAEMMPLPPGASLLSLPGYLPVGLDEENQLKLLEYPGGSSILLKHRHNILQQNQPAVTDIIHPT